MDVVFCEIAPFFPLFYIIHLGYYIACSSLDWLAGLRFVYVTLSNAVIYSCVRYNHALRVYFEDSESLFIFLLARESIFINFIDH